MFTGVGCVEFTFTSVGCVEFIFTFTSVGCVEFTSVGCVEFTFTFAIGNNSNSLHNNTKVLSHIIKQYNDEQDFWFYLTGLCQEKITWPKA